MSDGALLETLKGATQIFWRRKFPRKGKKGNRRNKSKYSSMLRKFHWLFVPAHIAPLSFASGGPCGGPVRISWNRILGSHSHQNHSQNTLLEYPHGPPAGAAGGKGERSDTPPQTSHAAQLQSWHSDGTRAENGKHTSAQSFFVAVLLTCFQVGRWTGRNGTCALL